MEIEKLHIDYIKTAFQKMHTKKALLNLLNYAKPLIYGDKSVPFTINQITWYSNPKLNNNRYIDFKIKKKSGGERTIHAPNNGLKAIQKTLNLIFQCVFEPHKSAMGFVAHKSIVDNAKIHVNRNYVYNIDLKDFFSSIDQARVWKCLQLEPFNLIDKEPVPEMLAKILGYNKLKVLNIITALCCTEMEVERFNTATNVYEKVKRNVLPQGAPTSPTLTNVVCHKLDIRLNGVAKKFGLRYSRYADDITFSSMHDVYKRDGEFIKEINRIIQDQGFEIKESKTRLQKTGYRQEVTGLVVNENANVQQRYIKQLRMWLYYWEKYGYEKAYYFFFQQYLTDKGNIVKGRPNMDMVIVGKLNYLKMVKGADNEMYLKLRNRFDILKGQQNPIDQLLFVWENEGINEAMEVYYKDKLE
jgi:retron-type reverse transcriptase